MTDRPHGYARYKLDGCRCYTCGWAVAQYNDAREHAIRRGTWQPYVDAAPVREHVLNLKACGFGDRAIAALAGLDRKAVRTLLLGRAERGTPPPAQIRPATATAILSVEPTLANLPDCTVVGSVGIIRRLRALVAAGWPQAHLGARLGQTPSSFSTALRRDQTTARTARAVQVLYNDLWQVEPQIAGVGNQPYARAVNHARAAGWAPIGAWDDDSIDDPAAEPNWTGECGTEAGYYRHRQLQARACPRCRTARYVADQARKFAAA